MSSKWGAAPALQLLVKATAAAALIITPLRIVGHLRQRVCLGALLCKWCHFKPENLPQQEPPIRELSPRAERVDLTLTKPRSELLFEELAGYG